MLAAYYQMKTSKNRQDEVVSYYSNILAQKPDYQDLSSKCRVCLQEGNSSFFGKENTDQILEVLLVFGNTTVTKNDNHSKLLCSTCYNFLRQAVIFRKVVLHSAHILKKTVNKESERSMGDGNSSDDIETEELQNWTSNTKEMESNTEESVSQDPKPAKTQGFCEYNGKVACHICKKLVTSVYLKSHLTMHEPDQKKFMCEICGKAFRQRSTCTTHILKHSTDFKYKCEFCPYKSQNNCLLKIHTRTHTKDYRYLCTECPARFLVKSNLSSHMRKHKDPQFKCENCERAFYTNAMLQHHHKSIHLGIKSHECNICGAAFGHRKQLTSHQLVVHKREKLLYRRMPSYLKAQNSEMTQ